MTINVNTSGVGFIAQRNFSKNVTSLYNSVEKLSSGLRINRTADDPVSAIISDQLKAQALGLGQAVRNANDGISVMQIVDGSLGESIDILNSVKLKVIQAAQDSLTTDSRRTLQEDVDKLLAELDLLVESTTYNGKELLTGVFSDKKFQVGAYPNETISVTLPAVRDTQIGYVRSGELSLTTTGGKVSLTFVNPNSGKTLNINSVDIAYNNDADNGMESLAKAVNLYSSETGISARSIVETISSSALLSGTTASSFSVNDIAIGAVTVQANDADGSLIKAINAKTTSHGVTASTTSSGQLQLVADDGRPIEVSGSGGGLGFTDSSMTTFGYVQIYQAGPYKLNFTDSSSGFAVAFSTNLKPTGSVSTTIDSAMAPGSVLGGGSTLTAGFKTGMVVSGANLSGDILTTTNSTLTAGSVLASSSTIAKLSVLGGSSKNNNSITTTANSLLESGSILLSGTVIAQGTYLTNGIVTASGAIAAGTVLGSDTTLTADLTLSNDMMILDGSVIASGATFTAGSYIGQDFTLNGSLSVTLDMTLLANSTIVDTSTTIIGIGSTVGGTAVLAAGDMTVTQEMLIKSGSTLGSTTELSTGSTIGGVTVVLGDHTATEDIYLSASSILMSNSLIKTGTVFTNDITVTGGVVSNGTTSSQDYLTVGVNIITNAMTIKSGSVLGSGSTLAANSKNEAATQISNEKGLRLVDMSVLTKDDAETAIEIVDAALADLDRIRAETGAVQNQFQSSVSALGGQKVNIDAARSKILDIDFAEETANFTRMQLLVQSSAFALTQANASPASILNLFQGNVDQRSNQFFSSLINTVN